MKKILLLFLLALECNYFYSQNNSNKYLFTKFGVSEQNLYNGFNSPIVYSGVAANIAIGYHYDKINKYYQELKLSFSIADLRPNIFGTNATVLSLYCEFKYNYLQQVYHNSHEKFFVYAGGCILSDFGLRNNSAMSNNATDINLAPFSLGVSAAINYIFSQRFRLALSVDMPVVSYIYCTHYLGGILIDDKLQMKMASFGSYQKFDSELSAIISLKNGNALKFSYDFIFNNNSNNQKITFGNHCLSLSLLFRLNQVISE